MYNNIHTYTHSYIHSYIYIKIIAGLNECFGKKISKDVSVLHTLLISGVCTTDMDNIAVSTAMTRSEQIYNSHRKQGIVCTNTKFSNIGGTLLF